MNLDAKVTSLPFPRYMRKGKCKRCGACCLNEDCKHLGFNRKAGITTCKIYDSPDRPSKCGIYPGNPPILNPDCGYYFIDRWSNDKIIAAGEGLNGY